MEFDGTIFERLGALSYWQWIDVVSLYNIHFAFEKIRSNLLLTQMTGCVFSQTTLGEEEDKTLRKIAASQNLTEFVFLLSAT
jgi:hypothetical protein